MGASLRDASFDHALVKGGSFVRADLTGATLREVDVRGADFSRANMTRGILIGGSVANARFDGADLTDAALDGTTFLNTSLRDATLRESARDAGTPSVGARFVDCDLTHVDWTGRDLRKTTFVRCKLGSSRGAPALFDDDAFEDCDGAFSHDVDVEASLRDDRGIALPRDGIAAQAPTAPVLLTPGTTAIASLEQGGERFEARKYEAKDGIIDVVRYAADGAVLEKYTFTWNGDYMLWDATLSHSEGDNFELEIFGEHWKGATPYREKFHFRRTPRTTSSLKWHEEAKLKAAERLAEAEQQARQTGKEPFDLRRLEALLNRGPQDRREADHRVRYYVLCPELRTLADYARMLLDEEPWADA